MPKKAFKSKENALAEKKELEKSKRASEDSHYWYDGELPKEFYRIDEVEVPDENPQSYKEIREGLKTARDKAVAVAKTAFDAGCKELFAAHEDLKSFGFHCYTPGFNDGDPCVWRASTDTPYINGWYSDDPQRNDDGEECPEDYFKKEYKDAKGKYKIVNIGRGAVLADIVSKFLGDFAEEDLKRMFGGDNLKITITRSGMSTEDYDCGY